MTLSANNRINVWLERLLLACLTLIGGAIAQRLGHLSDVVEQIGHQIAAQHQQLQDQEQRVQRLERWRDSAR